jgi:hypothetical protein
MIENKTMRRRRGSAIRECALPCMRTSIYLHTCTCAACLMRMWGGHMYTRCTRAGTAMQHIPAMTDGGLRVTSSIVAARGQRLGDSLPHERRENLMLCITKVWTAGSRLGVGRRRAGRRRAGRGRARANRSASARMAGTAGRPTRDGRRTVKTGKSLTFETLRSIVSVSHQRHPPVREGDAGRG